MRSGRTCVALLVMMFGLPTCAEGPAQFDWPAWGRVAIQDDGRLKPLDTLAQETFRLLSHQTKFRDPETGRVLSSTQLYLELLFSWRGWDQPSPEPPASGPQGHAQYFGRHQPDKWDRAPLLRVNDRRLRSELGMAQGERSISPWELSQAPVTVPRTHLEQPFLVWTESLLRKDQRELTEYETAALALARCLWAYQDHRMGNRFCILPASADTTRSWMSLAQIVGKTDVEPNVDLADVRRLFLQARRCYLNGAPAEFNRASHEFLAAVCRASAKRASLVAQPTIDLEVLYNRWAPFRAASVFMTLACFSLLLSHRRQTAWLTRCGAIFYLWATLAIVVGFAIRIAFSGRAPAASMYETVLSVSLTVAVIGACLALLHKRLVVLTASAAVAAFGLILADNCPLVLDPAVRILPPVLQSDFWLVAHVLTATSGYAALAVALAISNVTLGRLLLDSENRSLTCSLTRCAYRSMQLGVWLLTTGTVLGAIWADHAWGRFWGWDPKEVWALITLLGYAGVLYAYRSGRVRHCGLAALSITSFALVIMAWYGVNYVLRTGLHSYGFGRGGVGWVVFAMTLEGLYVAVAVWRYVVRTRKEARLRSASWQSHSTPHSPARSTGEWIRA